MILTQLINDFGVSEFANSIGEKIRTVQSWRNLEKAPRPQTVLNIRENHEITWEGIYLPIALKRSQGLSNEKANELACEMMQKGKSNG